MWGVLYLIYREKYNYSLGNIGGRYLEYYPQDIAQYMVNRET